MSRLLFIYHCPPRYPRGGSPDRDGCRRAPEMAIKREDVRQGGEKVNNHHKKIIAPVIITVLILVYLIAYGAGAMAAGEVNPLFLLLVIPVALLGAGMVCVLIARIREIRGGEEDDLDNY